MAWSRLESPWSLLESLWSLSGVSLESGPADWRDGGLQIIRRPPVTDRRLENLFTTSGFNMIWIKRSEPVGLE